jgi:hypothetical protein
MLVFRSSRITTRAGLSSSLTVSSTFVIRGLALALISSGLERRRAARRTLENSLVRRVRILSDRIGAVAPMRTHGLDRLSWGGDVTRFIAIFSLPLALACTGSITGEMPGQDGAPGGNGAGNVAGGGMSGGSGGSGVGPQDNVPGRTPMRRQQRGLAGRRDRSAGRVRAGGGCARDACGDAGLGGPAAPRRLFRVGRRGLSSQSHAKLRRQGLAKANDTGRGRPTGGAGGERGYLER